MAESAALAYWISLGFKSGPILRTVARFHWCDCTALWLICGGNTSSLCGLPDCLWLWDYCIVMRWSVSRNPAGHSDGGVGFAICAAVFQISTCGVGKSHSPVPLLTRGVYVVSSGLWLLCHFGYPVGRGAFPFVRLPASWGGGSPTRWPSRVDTNLIVGCAVSNLRLRGRLVGLGAFSFARRTAP